KAEPQVEIAGVFPEDSHPPIVYPVAVVTSSQNPDAEAFVTYLSSPKAQEIFTAQGFTVLK
ncbi:MAG: extracellular solute-binding protein, partial [Parvibaculaceae bacterium]